MLPIYCLHLPNGLMKRLLDSGFMFAEDLFAGNSVLKPEVEQILNSPPGLKDVLIECLNLPQQYSAKQILKDEKSCPRILSFSFGLDKILRGGIPSGGIFEVCGPPGSGKTQFCMQLCINVQLHSQLGGLHGEAVYVDTDAAFSPQRMKEIENGCKEHCCRVAKEKNLSKDAIQTLEQQSYSEYHYMSVIDHSQLLTSVYSLDDLVEKHKKVKLIIIDNLAFPFLQITDMLKRTVLLCKILQHLNRLAVHHNLAVVVTNHLTTRISRGEDQLIPALGECVGYLMNHRLMLGFLPCNQFAAIVFKSPLLQNNSAGFQVTGDGIRDVQ